jgi:hypothetical protein
VLTHDKTSAWGHRFQRPPRIEPPAPAQAGAQRETAL